MADWNKVVHQGETYLHIDYGRVRVQDIINDITSIGPDGPEKTYMIEYVIASNKSYVLEHELKQESYEVFVSNVEPDYDEQPENSSTEASR